MTVDQLLVVSMLVAVLAMFASETWRYDIVALVALLGLTILGIVPAANAFLGFGHPAVVTVAAMLIISRGLENSGVVDLMTKTLASEKVSPFGSIAVLTGLVTVFSGFMNNIGALALMLPVALQVAAKNNVHSSRLLMPLAFGSILGGLMTLIGTPPNIIVATYRAEALGQPFEIFDFTPVGIAVAAAGVTVVTLLARKVIPKRRVAGDADHFAQLEPYITEVSVPQDSELVGARLSEVERHGEGNIAILELIRDDEHKVGPRSHNKLRANDVLVVEADPDSLKTLLFATDLQLASEKRFKAEHLVSEHITISEAVVLPRSQIIGRTAVGLGLRSRYGINLLAIARQGANIKARLGHARLRGGDVLLLQGDAQELPQKISQLECLPLAERRLELRGGFQPWPILILLAALAASVVNLAPTQIALAAAAVLLIIGRQVSLRETYESIDWPIIILIGAMVPVGQSLESTGVTKLIGAFLISTLGSSSSAMSVLALMLVAMALSNIVNNAATAILMAPIALTVANGLNANVDPFLMAVAVGSSCAFVTPIGHQSNLLVMGPAGYRFGDYWRLGLPLSCVVVLIAVPMILMVWPI